MRPLASWKMWKRKRSPVEFSPLRCLKNNHRGHRGFTEVHREINETCSGGVNADSVDPASRDTSLVPAGPGRSPARRRRPTLHDGVLLQSPVGTSAGDLAALPEEPLPAPQENSGKRPH